MTNQGLNARHFPLWLEIEHHIAVSNDGASTIDIRCPKIVTGNKACNLGKSTHERNGGGSRTHTETLWCRMSHTGLLLWSGESGRGERRRSVRLKTPRPSAIKKRFESGFPPGGAGVKGLWGGGASVGMRRGRLRNAGTVGGEPVKESRLAGMTPRMDKRGCGRRGSQWEGQAGGRPACPLRQRSSSLYIVKYFFGLFGSSCRALEQLFHFLHFLTLSELPTTFFHLNTFQKRCPNEL